MSLQTEHEWTCPAAGQLVMLLDNSQAWHHRKKVQVSVEQWVELTSPTAAEADEACGNQDLFAAAVGNKPLQHPNATQAIKHQLYGLYKQAVRGPCNIPRPRGFNFDGKAKRDHWNRLGEMSKPDAKAAFVQLANTTMGLGQPCQD